ncbi:MAG: flavin reductase family protein [Bacillota bacterium]
MAKSGARVSPAVYPSGIVLVSSGTLDGTKNIITLAWAANCSAEPPMTCIAVRPSRHSHGIISGTGEFVINIPQVSQLREADYCGQVSGRERDKFADCKFTAGPAQRVKAPLINECPVNIECVVKNTVRAGTHDLFVAEIVAVNGDVELVEGGKVNFSKVDLIAYAQNHYYRLGPALGVYGFSTSGK